VAGQWSGVTQLNPERRASFEALFDAHQRGVRAYALRRGAGASADDVVAETFLVAWRRLDAVDEDPLPWLLGVARRVLSNERRGERRRLALFDRLLGVDGPPAPEPTAVLDERLAGALAGLSPTERDALLLVAWEGLSPDRAARAAGCSAATFRVRLHRARRHVARALNSDAQRPEDATPPSLERTR
jgi:RNA polymerase sigma-70 factor (ECF subfamily)